MSTYIIKAGFSQALFFPKQHAGEFRDLRIATRGSCTLRYEFASKLTLDSANFWKSSIKTLILCTPDAFVGTERVLYFVCGAQCWEQLRMRSRV